jgi:hypothetical protein
VKLVDAAEAKSANRGTYKRKKIMPSEREKMESWSEKAVFDSMSNAEPGSPVHTRATAEIRRRSMEVERNALAAQQRSAEAASDAAKSSRTSTRYALFAIIIAALSLAASLFALFRK